MLKTEQLCQLQCQTLWNVLKLPLNQPQLLNLCPFKKTKTKKHKPKSHFIYSITLNWNALKFFLKKL